MKTAKIIRDNHGSLEEGATGLGEISEAQICSRAEELAISDGRPGVEYTETDYEQAKHELAGTLYTPSNPPANMVNGIQLVEQAVATSGHRIPKGEFEDEETIGAELVKEGIEEAQHDEMVESGKITLRDEDLEK